MSIYEIDPQIEKMVLDGIRNQRKYKSSSGASLSYRAISDLEERFALKDLLEAFAMEDKTVLSKLFEKRKDEKYDLTKRLVELGLSPVDYEIADVIHKVSIIYHGIKDFHLADLTEDDAKEIIGKFGDKDLDKLSSNILKLSSATSENQERVKKFHVKNKSK